MRKKQHISFRQYLLIFLSTLLVDRITKNLIVCYVSGPITINSYLSYDFVLNRGISWGIFHSTSDYLFLALSIVIACIILGIGFYTFIRWMNHESVIGEVLVLAGAMSNLIDRILYHGVIDFIALSWGSFCWPVFNIADAAIVVGVALMFIESYRSA